MTPAAEARLCRMWRDRIRAIAYRAGGPCPMSLEVEDLHQAGAIGLVKAARAFKKGQGAKFSTYAGIRIRGEVVDAMRTAGWFARHTDYRLYNIGTATEQRIEPSDLDAPDYGVLHTMLVTDDNPADLAEVQEQREKLARAIPKLGYPGAAICRKYLTDRWRLWAIGIVYGLSESRVCQMVRTELPSKLSRLISRERLG